MHSLTTWKSLDQLFDFMFLVNVGLIIGEFESMSAIDFIRIWICCLPNLAKWRLGFLFFIFYKNLLSFFFPVEI